MSDGVSKRMGNLSPEKQALLVLQMKKKKAAEAAAARTAAAGAAGAGGVQRRPDPSVPTPLSFAQQRLWLLDRLEPGTTAYNIPAQARLRGALDIAALELAIDAILRRHEGLRTTFSDRDAQPVQVIAPPQTFRLPVADLAGLPEELRRDEERRLLAANARPFDLERGPLFRANLARLGAGEHLLLLDMHHVVSDGWSFGVFFRELAALYESFHEGRAPTLPVLPELPVQYPDFAVWQRDWLQGAVLAEQLAWWRERLAGAPPELELPLDRVRPAVQTHRGRSAHADLPPALVARLRELSLQEGASPFMTFLAAFQLLLSRLSGQDDVVVGSPSAGRSRAEIEGLIGLFLNTLVLRTDLSGDPTFRELLGRVKEVVLGAYQYQAIPFERLLEELQPERQLSRTPIFQVLFNFVSIENLRMSLSGVEVDLIESAESESKFDFTLYVNELPDSLRFNLVYNADLFEPERMAEMLRQLEHLLAQAAVDPERRIGELSLVTPAAAALLPDPAQALAGDWRGAVHQALSHADPDRVAVQDAQGTVWTYAELEARANQLAHRLISGGVEKGDAVAVWAHRSAPLVQALMGTLKAGAAFMILDPAYPVPRLLDYMRIGRPTAWISVPGAPPPPTEVEEAAPAFVDLDMLSGLPETDPGVPIGPDDAACLTFTSGSTGMPKGVVGRHGPLTHFQPWMAERFGLGADDRFGMLSALSHDPLQRDVFTPVWLGARMVLPDPERIGAPGYLAAWLRSERVSVLHLTPAMMEIVLDSTENGPEPIPELPDLRRAFVVGDLLKKGDVEHLQGIAPSAVCVNLYGSTETQRSVSFFEVPRHPGLDRLGKEVLPLGRGMDGCQLLVLNRGGRLAGVGESGEIHLRSRHLARGYLGDEVLTAERFLLASPEEGDRVYKTGDLGRYLPDGNVEFAGRADFQVKLRGFRIELGEVEAALARYPGVRECVVIVREDRPGDRRLVGYLVMMAVSTAPPELRAFLGVRLPDYMVPAAFVVLPALPLTRTGKVDRRALPAPVEDRAEAERPGERSAVEELLSGIWADLLGVSAVARDDSFFALGGHSLLATRMISRVRAVLGLELPLRSVFEEPTLAGFAALAERAQWGEAAGVAPPPLVPVPRDGEPLLASFSQQRLWFLDRLEPGSFAYNLTGGVRLAGRLDAAALEGALAGIVHRHESLRTTFVEREGEPWQVIAEPAPLALPVVDLSGLPEERREDEARRIAAAVARRPYDLARGPLVRTALLRLDGREHALVVGMHHIVSDGWSMGVFVRELGALYRGHAGDPPLPELPIQYADFAAWQRQWLSGEVMEERLAWWKEQLAGVPQVVELPLDRPRPAVQTSRGGRAELLFGHGVEERLESLGRRLGATPFMILLAAWATLLRRYGSQDEVVVGTPIANRERAELEGVIGFFANTLALRVDLSGDPTGGDLTRRIREAALGAYARQDVPFERLVDELRPQRSLSFSPVFQVVLAFQNLPTAELDLAGLTLSPLAFDNGHTPFDLSLFLRPQPDAGGLLAQLVYASDLFDAATAGRMLEHFHRLLAAMAAMAADGGHAADTVRLSELPLLADEEREQVLRRWNDTATAYPRDATVHGLFAEQARQRPEAVAVVGAGEQVTYAELDRRADRLAARLLQAGVRPDDAVGLCAERSCDLIAALLGILKAGGAYVPLDPDYPQQRLAGMLADTDARIVLVQEGLEASLPETGAARLPLRATLASERGPAALPTVQPDQLAYVLFTSGSTGRPKGVAVSHRGVVRLVRETDHTPVGPGEVFLQLAPVSFDASTLEIWAPLLNGGRLALFPPGPPDLREIGEAVERHGVTALFLTAGLFHQMVESHLESLRPVRQLTSGGEVLSPAHVRRVLAGLPGMTMTNAYGPTENTTYTTAYPMRSESDAGTGSVPIGRPIANSQVYLLDAAFQPVPVGVVGRLYAAGDGLARGYAGRPDLTAERFVPDPVSGEAGARLYDTGDLARWRASGDIEFFGRADTQVKIRGFRIEPGEIEAVLSSHPDVDTAIVLAREDTPGDKRLAAYVVPTAERSPIPAELRAWLAARLPPYMVPAAFVLMAELPLTPAGKVDRRRLPAPAGERQHREPARPGERSPLEELLAGIWSGLLGVPGVAPDESFFDLGGHSLLATRLISQVRSVLGVELPLRALFEEPTLAGFAALAEQARQGEGGPAVPPLARVPRGVPLPTSFSQQRLWFLDRLEPGSLAYNLSGAVRLEGALDAAALAAALSAIVGRHESLRTTFVEEHGEPWQVVAAPSPLPLPIFDLAGLPPAAREQETLRIAAAEARRPYDLARGPLVRSTLLRLGAREHVLLVGMHHIVSDGWSLGVFVRELGALYRGHAGDPPLPELPVQYGDYAAWQRQWLTGEVMAERLAWWTRHLAGAPAVIELPLDRPRPAVQTYRGGRVDLVIGREPAARLEALARSLGVTPFMALLAGFSTLLSRYALHGGQTDVVVGTPVANRGRAELEDLIGFFVNTLALRVDLAGNPGFDGLALRVREMALGAFARQEIPFERLVSELQPERSLSYSPVFQVLLAFQNLPDSRLDLEGLTLAPLDYESGRTQFDLALFVHPLPEGGLLARLNHSRDLFDPATVQRLLGHLETLLEGAAAEPEAPLSRLPLLTAAERMQFAQVERRGHAEGLLHALFEAQARRTPEAVALVAGEDRLTYAELEERSARLAARLQSLGIGPETGVAVCQERTADLVVSLLGVLRSGGFYVPIDPRYPDERQRFLVEDSGARLVLTRERLAELLAEPAALTAAVTPGNLAYLIYTSGSTGRPKAVAIEHRSASVFAQWARESFSPEELRSVLASTAVTFDLSVFEIFVTLAWGGTVVLVENALAEIPAGVTLINTVPSAMAELLRNDRLPASVRTINLAGEALPRWLADLAYARPETERVCNLYGPSEDTTYSTWTVVERSTDRPPSIGRPVHDTRASVLDPWLERLPVGVSGELCLAGAGLARGYLGRPELTAERFVPDPFSEEPGARMYRTGDLARLRQDGELDYLGRLDHQVKVRGFRIELGEVEAALTRQPGVESAVVLAREDAPGDRRLVAYIVGAATDLRQALLQELPEPMVPSAFVFLEAFPLTPHGKVDRRALPAPQASHEIEVSVERSPAEELLAGIWSALLPVSVIGPRDNFFDLGGHSLLATQVVSRVRDVFGVELPLRALFETPTLAGLATRIQAEGTGLQAPPIVPLPRDGEARASFAQERLWFLDLFGTDRASYNIPAAVRLEGRLDVPALAACLTEIVRRHESLRTSFAVTGGSKVLQVIAPPAEVPLPVVDIAALPDPETEATGLAREEARRVFDLQRGPVLRAVLVKLGEREHTLFLSVHHIVADGWSIGVLVRELSALYSAFAQGRPSPLPELPVQYADFAAWQRSWLQGEVLEAQLGWWRETLAGAPAVIELPADRPRPPVQSARGGRVGVALPAELSQDLQALVRSEGSTLFMALLAGFQALLARTTGREDLPVGTPIANRNRAEIEDLIGFFVNTLVMRGDLSGDPSFREMLARSREAALGAYAHQDVPFEKLVEELRPERDLSHSPLFQAMVILHNAPMEALELPELTVVPVGADSVTSKFDLRLALMQTPEGLAGSLVYNRDLFDASTVERLGGYLETLLTAAVANPELPLSELPLLGEAERRQLLQWGDARPTSDGRALLHRLFEAQASDRTAVTCDGEHLTYRELDMRANRLAHALIAEGVRPGDLVGLRLQRSLDMVVAVLGVLKAGGAYLPLDPTYPEERLAFAIEDSRVAVVVTQEWLGRAERHSPESPGVEVTPDFPAYVIYTSGSTGRPKGVVVTHANATRLFAATDAWFGFGPDDVWTLFHSYAFDFSVWELWGALLYGGRLVVVPYWVSRSPEAFYELVRDERVTVLNQTPSAFRQLLWAEESILTSLRYVIFGGEALELASLAPWYERHAEDRPRLVNMYGITETTVHVTWRPLSRKDVEEARGSVIGVPIPDLSLRVLDRDLRLQPIGVPGEIHVGGEGLAMGYLGRPELTAERFVPDPFGPAGARLYRSGDLARYLADGDVEYLGRIDHQVKIRGFRIELGEIETALTSQPEIREAVVLAREDKPGDKRLVAYLVGELAGDLRERLKAKLPEYMVPAAFVTLPALPLTANGKVDRRALPVPEAAPAQKRDRVAPRTGLELFLAELWQSSLSAEVGIEDDFFEMGGNSITGAILINRLQETLDEIVHVVVIFDAPTVERMAAYLIANHTEAVARVWGEESLGGAIAGREQVNRIDAASVEQMRGLVRPLPLLARSGPKNPPAVFVLAPPRSGTTLMRVLLGGHPRLFAPPELELLSCNTLAERKATYTGRDAFWLEGLVRAVMEIRGCAAEEATETIAIWEQEGWTARRAYGRLQEWLGRRILVDKTPSYALDPEILQRAEEDFEEPLYVHLVRHPYGMIRSFEEAKLDQIFFRQEHPFERRELAELIWLVSQENILSFLEKVPKKRQHLVRFEDLVRDPEPVLRGLCDFLGLDFHPAMLQPYEERSRRMTDGVHAESRMLGDVKFHTHSGIDASTAERWREAYQEDFLGVPTARMAAALGYEVRAAGQRHAAMARRGSTGPAPLTSAQQRLWLLDRLEPGSTAYNIPSPMRLRGALNVAALERALDEILRRHEALRTTFAEQDGEPVQVVAPPAGCRLPVTDLSHLAEEERRAEGDRLVAEHKQPFDLECGPLFRAGLVRLGGEEHLLLLDVNHIVSDGWSLGIFFRELGALYGAFAEGRPSPLPELPVQYADFAVWQREWLQGPVLDEQLAYWRERLAGSPPALELPVDRLRPPVQTHRGDIVPGELPAGLIARLRELSLRERTSLFMTLLAAFQLLLSRLSGQDDVVVGSPSAGRSRVEVEDLIGLFLNTLVLRTDLSGDPTFRELLGRVREAVLGAYRYQAIPFERLLEELQPDRQLSRTPIFQVLFNYVSSSDLQPELPGLRVEAARLGQPDSKFDFTLYVSETPKALRFNLVYNADLFDRGRMEEMLRQLERLLDQASANPEARIGSLSLVTPTAAALLPDPAQPLGGEWRGAVHEALSRNAARHPDRIAVEDAQGTSWTYAELESRANRLAHFLVSHGVEKGNAVAVWAHRSAPLVQALMGTLKAGAAFMVLDPAYPVPRLLDYLRIGRPVAWVAVPGAPPPPAEVEEAAASLRRLELDDLSGYADTDPGVPVGPDDAACITFTSGSTGVPKGVVGRHAPLTCFYPWMGERFGLGGDDRFGMLSALSHDPLQRDVFTPVWFGAGMVLPDPDRIGAPGYLAGWLRSERVTVLHLTPAMMEMVLDSTDNGPERIPELPDLRRAFVVGDLLKKGDVEHLQGIAPSVVCVNLYGSTETQRSVSFFEVPRAGSRLGKEVLPLGRGMEGCQLLVLNPAGRLAGVGEAGEIHLRSRNLARGYLGDEALTAERFLPNPLVAFPEEGDRVYKTGDLGRYLPEGGVELIGRVDFQVKLRGFRIELGEVEAALTRYPGVRECVVIVREDRPGDRRLVGYLVTAEGAPAQRDLRAFLFARLPEYMVPASFVILPALPLTRTGKVDRRALPPPVEEHREVAEKSPVEELLAGIWCDLLGVADAAPEDNFFELGGQSLLATRMISRVRAVLGVDLPLRAVFEEPTLAGFAALAELAREGGMQASIPLVRVSRSGPLPASFAQQRLWFLDQLEPGSAAYNLSGGVRLAGPLDVPALTEALSGIVRRHESLRTTFVDEDGQPRQVIGEPASLPVAFFDLSGLPAAAREEEVRRIAAAEARRPYDLSRGPLVRCTLVRLDEREHALLVGFHHIVADGWSLGIFVRELGALFRGHDQGQSLPDLPIQYADYAAWQRDWLRGEVLEERLAWWKFHLGGAPQVVELPLDHPRPAVQSYRGRRTYLALESGLEPVARRLGVTPFMVLLGAFTTLLTRYGSQPDAVVGTPIANRGRAELEDLIGMFANTLALRVDLSGDPGFDELARRVRQVALGAYAHQDIPFERLVDELRPERDLSHAPVFQVMLALQNLPGVQLDLRGLALTPLEFEVDRTQYDLSLFLFPRRDGGMLARLEYAADLFDAGTAERLLLHVRNLLDGIAEAPNRRLSDLPLLGAGERQELLAAGNRTAAEVPPRLLHQLFEDRVRERPEAVAVAYQGESLTYAELNARANRLAHHLRGLGVGPERLVAVCLERSPAMLTALLGVLKAGGAYVPLDPTYPADRIAWVLEDSRASVVLTQSDLDQLDLSGESAADPEPLAGPENLAYVIYTSGSTGRPKGVAVRQRGAVNFLASMARQPGLGSGDVLLAVTTIAFDIAVLELFLPLSRGARIELVDRDTAADGLRLMERIAGSGATVMQATPATWRVLLEAGWEGSPGLKVLCGGEALPPDLARELLARTRELWNVYGPTETTVWSAVHRVSAADAVADTVRPMPLGGAIANTQIYLLGRSGEPVPPGAPGELHIGGEGLARGYLGRPDLTAERFVPDPFASGARLYRTGDLVRRRTQDGALEFLGRVDHQVKIRGFRIELGEIEAVLSAQPSVRECAVVVREDVPGSKRLVAYVALHEGDSEVLRGALRDKLPEYMVPQLFAVLPSLPLTPNGKIDRRALLALPAPEGARGATEIVAPRNPVEEILAAVWAEVLKLDRVGIHDNFFTLGGDSILVIQAATRSRKRGVSFTPRQLFQNQTVAGLAAMADAAELQAPVAASTEFSEAGLSQDELDDLLAELAE